MPFKNDLLELNGKLYRYLQSDPQRNLAWVIAMEEFAMPKSVALSDISGLGAVEQHGQAQARTTTEAERRVRDRAADAITPLLEHGPALFDDKSRFEIIKIRSHATGASIPSLYKWLRMYWQNGQCVEALTPRFRQCGASGIRVTAGRGTKSPTGKKTYQLTDEDFSFFEEILNIEYFKDRRKRLVDVYQSLLEKRYTFFDGNGRSFIKDDENRPSIRQFRYYLNRTYSMEVRLRHRLGDKEFDRNHRGVLGTVEEDCLGVGHIYECDATIGDILLVANDDAKTIVGKPTIYIIIDRRSRLIVGLYVGFENASWVVAMQALLFICEDKEAICQRYAVAYDPADWPANFVFPAMFLGDMGELHQRAGVKLSERLYTRVAFTPGKRPDQKPVVETTFKQVRTALQPGLPGFDPPENAKQRQAIHYEKDACLTLNDFMKLMLELVIKHNRTARSSYNFSMSEVTQKFIPTPINVWNNEIASRSGALTRYSYQHVRFELLPRDSASVTEHGVAFKDCLYTNNELIRRGWFSQGRAKHFKVEVAFDHRLVDNIYVIDPEGKMPPLLCELSTRSNMHRGSSFAEVKVYQNNLKQLGRDISQNNTQVTSDFHAATAGTIKDALEALKKSPNKKSRSARRADTAEARAAALSEERQKSAPLKAPAAPDRKSLSNPPGPQRPPAVVDFRLAKEHRDSQTVSGGNPPNPRPAATGLPDKEEMARRALEKIRSRSNTK